MPAIPVDKVLRTVAPREVFARYSELALALGAGGVDDRVVMLEQIGARDVPAETHVAEEAHLLPVVERGAQYPCHRLDLLVVRGDSVTYQAVRSREPVEHVDADSRRRREQGLHRGNTVPIRAHHCPARAV